jgi:WD40 repeat protein
MGTGHAARVTTCAVSPDGAFFVSASVDHTLKMWDPSTGEEIRTLSGHPDEVLHCAVGPDRFVYSGGKAGPGFDAIVKIWDPETGGEVAGWQSQMGDIRGLIVSPAGDFVAAFAGMGWVEIRDPISGAERQRVDADPGLSGGSFVSSADGRFLAITDRRELIVADPTTGERFHTFRNPDYGKQPFAITPNGESIVFLQKDSGWTVGNVGLGDTRPVEGGGYFSRCVISPDGTLTAGTFQEKTQEYSSLTGAEVRKIGNAEIHIRETDSGTLVREIDLGNEEATVCAFSPDGSLIYVAGAESLRVFDVQSGEEAGSIPLEAETTCMAVHPARPIVALGDAVGGFHVLDLGIDLERIIVTPTNRGAGTETQIRCPACYGVFSLTNSTDTDCPACRTPLRVNPFVLTLRETPSRPATTPGPTTPAAAPASARPAATTPEPAPTPTSPERPAKPPPSRGEVTEEINAILRDEMAEAGVQLDNYPQEVAQKILVGALAQAIENTVDAAGERLDAGQKRQALAMRQTAGPPEVIEFLYGVAPDLDVLGSLRAGLRKAFPQWASPGGRGKIYLSLGDQAKALALFEEQEELSRRTNDPAGLAEAMGNRGVLVRAGGDVTGALALHEEEARLFREIGDRRGLARSLGNRGLCLRAAGRDDEAMQAFKEKETIDREVDDPAGIARALGNQAEIIGNRGDIDTALRLLEDAAQHCRAASDWEQLAASLAGRGVFLMQAGRADEGVAIMEEAHGVATEHGLAQLAQQIEAFRLMLTQASGGSTLFPAATVRQDEPEEKKRGWFKRKRR